MAEPGTASWLTGAAALAGLAFGALMAGAPLAAGQALGTGGTARPASGQVVVQPSRDVSFTIDDRWGQHPPIVSAVDDESSERLRVYDHDIQPRDGAALLDFAVPSQLEGAAFSSAQLRMYAEDVNMMPDQPARTLWATGNATSWDPAAMAGQPVPPECCGVVPWQEASRQPGWITWDVSAIVAGWYAGVANHGLRVKSSGHIVSDHYYYSFSSMEGPHPPELVIEFGPLATGTAEPTVTPTLTPTEATPSSRPVTVTPTPALALWLPVVIRELPPPATSTPHPGPSATSSPSPTPGTGRYLLVERWQYWERGPGCGPMLIDFPTYRFDSATGTLHLWPHLGWNPALEPTDIGYFGSGASVNGRGGGAASGLERIEALPFQVDDTRIESVDDAGAIVASLGAETMELGPGRERRWQSVGPGDGEGCVVTTTLRITNFGYQDRSKIVYDE